MSSIVGLTSGLNHPQTMHLKNTLNAICFADNVSVTKYRETVSNLSNLHLKESDCLEEWSLANLLNIATRLQLPEEGLRVMQLVAERRCMCGNHDPLKLVCAGNNVFEPNLRAFAEFIVMSGWDKCLEIVLGILETREVDAYSAQLAICLFKLNCTEGAFQIFTLIINNMPLAHDSQLMSAVFELQSLLKIEKTFFEEKIYGCVLASQGRDAII